MKRGFYLAVGLKPSHLRQTKKNRIKDKRRETKRGKNRNYLCVCAICVISVSLCFIICTFVWLSPCISVFMLTLARSGHVVFAEPLKHITVMYLDLMRHCKDTHTHSHTDPHTHKSALFCRSALWVCCGIVKMTCPSEYSDGPPRFLIEKKRRWDN